MSIDLFRIPKNFKSKYYIEVLYWPSIPNSTKHWQVFEDDQQIKIFLKMIYESTQFKIESEQDLDETNDELDQMMEFENQWSYKIGIHNSIQLKNNVSLKAWFP